MGNSPLSFGSMTNEISCAEHEKSPSRTAALKQQKHSSRKQAGSFDALWTVSTGKRGLVLVCQPILESLYGMQLALTLMKAAIDSFL